VPQGQHGLDRERHGPLPSPGQCVRPRGSVPEMGDDQARKWNVVPMPWPVKSADGRRSRNRRAVGPRSPGRRRLSRAFPGRRPGMPPHHGLVGCASTSSRDSSSTWPARKGPRLVSPCTAVDIAGDVHVHDCRRPRIHRVVRDAVADDLVQRGAQRLRVTAVSPGCWGRRRDRRGTRGPTPVQFRRWWTPGARQCLPDLLEGLGGQPPGHAHALDGLRVLDVRFAGNAGTCGRRTRARGDAGRHLPLRGNPARDGARSPWSGILVRHERRPEFGGTCLTHQTRGSTARVARNKERLGPVRDRG